MDIRRTELSAWAKQCVADLAGLALCDGDVNVVSGDASFRRYFRLRLPEAVSLGLANEQNSTQLSAHNFILVDAPPQHENSREFVRIASLFRGAGLLTPRVLAVDYDSGFMLLEDFGDALYLPALQAGNQTDALYAGAIEALLQLQSRGNCAVLPPFDRQRLRTELRLFDDWFCGQFLGLQLSHSEQVLLDNTWTLLEDSALAQPQVCVHRDYHSRNLMVLANSAEQAPGVIDFQDAVSGPYTYDLVSLLRDCYIVWPPKRVQAWAVDFLAKAKAHNIVEQSFSEQQFLRDFDLMGLQRHIKVIGIFCRLNIRDGKPAYMNDIPLVIDYVLSVASQHPEMAPFVSWFEAKVLPVAKAELAAIGELT
jgi:aminoglycoside/choline kinase family phosphotransferase